MKWLANDLVNGDIELLANEINSFIQSILNLLPVLQPDNKYIKLRTPIAATFSFTVFDVDKNLSRVKAGKAAGPMKYKPGC